MAVLTLAATWEEAMVQALDPTDFDWLINLASTLSPKMGFCLPNTPAVFHGRNFTVN